LAAISSATSAEPDLSDDPLITGKYNSPGWIVLNVVGGVLSIPFVAVRALISGLESIEKSTATNTSTAIEPVSKSVTKSSGD
jgi:hypothetical protein